MVPVDKLAVYNKALLNLGQRRLANLSSEGIPRHLLDGAWDIGAPERCLEMAQPTFASTIARLDSPVTSPVHGLSSVHTLPGDYLTLVRNPRNKDEPSVYVDDRLSQPVARFIIGGRTLSCEHPTIYIRYIQNTITVSDWTPAFVDVVAAYLALELTEKISPALAETSSKRLEEAVALSVKLDAERSSPWAGVTDVTITNDWLPVYQDALLMLGLDTIASGSDYSNRRVKLDMARNAGAVASVLEETTWSFAATLQKMQHDPDLEQEWGPKKVFDKPPDMHRIFGFFTDEGMKNPLGNYTEMDGRIMCDFEDVYIRYVDSKWLTAVSGWPSYFRRLVAARMAKDAAQALKSEGADPAAVSEEYLRRLHEAMSRDVSQGPPRTYPPGSWVTARGGGYKQFGR